LDIAAGLDDTETIHRSVGFEDDLYDRDKVRISQRFALCELRDETAGKLGVKPAVERSQILEVRRGGLPQSQYIPASAVDVAGTLLGAADTAEKGAAEFTVRRCFSPHASVAIKAAMDRNRARIESA
jgi:hypothetical protein